MGERAVIYDITDDWTSLTQSPKLASLIAGQDADLCRRADATIVCSERLQEMKRPLTRSLHLIPNGVDAAHYRHVLDGTGPYPAESERWTRPVFGYTGTIHPDRVDVDLIEAVARRMTTGTIVLLGPDMLRPDERLRLLATGRIALPGQVAYQDIPRWMRAFDVCITPHRVTRFTESLNPIKLWEYLAAGKPIVSTPVAGFRDFAHVVRLAGTAESFLAAAVEAVGEAATPDGQRLQEQRRAIAREHSWERRGDDIVAVLQSVVARADSAESNEPMAAS